jgi:catechol 2,3-dioxygenase-like lactoylglutathione lyase family enzyme
MMDTGYLCAHRIKSMPQSLAHIALIVRDYDEAIGWFTQKLGFALVADEYQPEQDKRWVLVAPPGSGEGSATILLARAATPEQEVGRASLPVPEDRRFRPRL